MLRLGRMTPGQPFQLETAPSMGSLVRSPRHVHHDAVWKSAVKGHIQCTWHERVRLGDATNEIAEQYQAFVCFGRFLPAEHYLFRLGAARDMVEAIRPGIESWFQHPGGCHDRTVGSTRRRSELG